MNLLANATFAEPLTLLPAKLRAVVHAAAVVAVAAFPPMLQEAHVPLRFVMTPDVGVPRRGAESVGLVPKTMLPVPVEPVGVTPAIEISRPNVCSASQVFALLRLTSSVVAVEPPPTVSVEAGLVMLSPPDAEPSCVHTPALQNHGALCPAI